MKSILALLSFLASASGLLLAPVQALRAPAVRRLRGGDVVAASDEIAIIVDAEIEPSRVEEFLEVD